MNVAACFYADDGQYPNIKAANVRDRQALYWRCIAGMTSTVRRGDNNGNSILIFTNSTPPPEVADILESNFVRLINLPYETRLPSGCSTLFSGSLYTIDAIRWCSRNLREDEAVLFLDPDCIVAGGLSGIERAIIQHGLVAYDLRIPANRMANGMSRRALGRLCESASGGTFSILPRWLGGEFFGVRADVARQLADAFERVWQINLHLISEGKPALTTEEHVFSVTVAAEGIPFFDAGDGFVKRLWTGTRHRNHSPDDIDNEIWHLPAEKNRGFQRLYSLIGQPNDVWSQDENKRKLALAILFGLQDDGLGEAAYIFRRTFSDLQRLILRHPHTFSVGI